MASILAMLALTVGAACAVMAQDGAPKGFPFEEAPPRQDWAWDKDERFDELVEQLAINEASLEAVERAIAKKTRSQRGQKSAARRFDGDNRTMDRKGGGPMRWSEFYGTNAEKFFYHPVDPNTAYHTATALRQMGSAQDDKVTAGVPASQSVPVHQRPPQWDYIYRANRTAREQALTDAAMLQAEVAELEARLAGLEREQAELWCKLAFRAVRRLDLDRRPILRFQLLPAGSDASQVEQAAVLTAASRFCATALRVVGKAEEDQPVALMSADSIVTKARFQFDDSLIAQPSLEAERGTPERPLGQFVALSKMLGDKAKTLSEAYAGATGDEAAKDAVRKDRFRGLLQRTVVDYAQIVLALNELVDGMRKDWEVTVDTKSPVGVEDDKWVEAPRAAAVPAKGTSNTGPAGGSVGPVFPAAGGWRPGKYRLKSKRDQFSAEAVINADGTVTWTDSNGYRATKHWVLQDADTVLISDVQGVRGTKGWHLIHLPFVEGRAESTDWNGGRRSFTATRLGD